MTALERLDAVVAKIEANPETRYDYQEELHAALEQLKLEGGEVPPRLRELDDVLFEEAIEAKFDNLPV